MSDQSNNDAPADVDEGHAVRALRGSLLAKSLERHPTAAVALSAELLRRVAGSALLVIHWWDGLSVVSSTARRRSEPNIGIGCQPVASVAEGPVPDRPGMPVVSSPVEPR